MKTNVLKIFVLAAFALLLVLGTNACRKHEVKQVAEFKKVENKDITDYGKWYYFSFATGTFVGEGSAKPADGDDKRWSERTDWDIAFHRQNVRTNGGASGKGKGGIMELKEENLASVKTVPEGKFTEDEGGNKITIAFKMPPVPENYAEVSLNKGAINWVAFVHETMSWKLNKRNVFIVRTADGKYAKFQFVNFLNEKNKSGFLSFQYAFQKDGTKDFE